MLICIPNVLTKEQVAFCRNKLNQAEWIDGKATTGTQPATVKSNVQIPQSSPVAHELGNVILDALANKPQFISAALPLKIFPPLFNRYENGGHFGIHTDGSVMTVPGTSVRVRTDVSATLFLAEPEAYEGGELVIEDNFGAQEVKLAAGDMVLYPATSLHQVRPVTSGARLASFFWMQSMVRDDGQRTLLYDLDQSIQELSLELGAGHPQTVKLAGIYHNLVRRWADT
ncbi:MAG TPA: Fe2+-dependent dioxygenase [Candidatus Thiothrix moscowensis]|uniref:Fe2+-dependent dioxygenase n=1 Tax=unclassified Thiothrix TaxID=2636184 RepID=UPI0025F2F5DA|nr:MULTISPECIES: Fe2+-dependent dioxygenase [unclassified Thiothrix]HRJ52530.1 Fe2+-dependent dioxygenase [Candidatus Thiothrix moscowensis]HRJ93284.1 Fe2+-dependent dioxygenase [Candidatus Thiothrix moscowensis]